MSAHSIRLKLKRPLLTSNEQRRAHWTKVRDAKRNTEMHARFALRRADIAVVPPVEVWVTWYAPDARRRDSDSLGPCLKACLDALVNADIGLSDDSSEYVTRSGCSVVVDRADPRIEITIIELEESGMDEFVQATSLNPGGAA